MPGDTERDADLRARVEQSLEPGERLIYCTWVGRVAGRRHTGPAGDRAGSVVDWRRHTRTGIADAPDGSLAAALDAALPETATAMVLAVTGARVLLLGEVAPGQRPSAGGLRGLMDGIRDEMTGLVSSRPAVFGPVRPLRVAWQAPRAAVVHSHSRWGGFADRVVLGFTDASWLSVTAPHAKDLAAALAID